MSFLYILSYLKVTQSKCVTNIVFLKGTLFSNSKEIKILVTSDDVILSLLESKNIKNLGIFYSKIIMNYIRYKFTIYKY